LDTLAERHKFDDNDPSYDPDSVHSKAHRTDALLAGTVIVGAATAYVGVKLVDWSGQRGARVSLSASPTPFGGGFVATARF
jgi:hypothetical protein